MPTWVSISPRWKSLRRPWCLLWGMSWLHPGQEQSALRAESMGQAQSPRVMVVGRGWTDLPLLAPEASMPLLLTRERESSLLWPLFASHQMCPQTSSQVPSQATAEAEVRLSPPESIRRCCLYTSICSALLDAAERRPRSRSPLPSHGRLSLPHAYIPVVPAQADQACSDRAGWWILD